MITDELETFSDTVEEEHSVEACTKCTACNTVCPVARSTEIFRGPKFLGPESERYRDQHEATVTAPKLHVRRRPDLASTVVDTVGTGTVMRTGHKQGFCLRDSTCSGSGSPKYTCTDQGVSQGCGDVYDASLGCQYIDITGVPDGSYTLRLIVDPFGHEWGINQQLKGQTDEETHAAAEEFFAKGK